MEAFPDLKTGEVEDGRRVLGTDKALYAVVTALMLAMMEEGEYHHHICAHPYDGEGMPWWW